MQLTTNLQQTMTSRQIAEAVDSDHHNVMATIRRLIREGVISGNETPYIHPQNGQQYTEFNLDYRNTMVVASGYSAELRAKIIDRWIELEGKKPAPKELSRMELIQIAYEAEKENIQLRSDLEAAQPAIQMVERYVEAKSSKCLSDVAKILNWKPQAFIAKLADDGVIFKRSGSWVPYQHHIDVGRFTVKTGESNGHAFHQARVEPSGIEWLAKKYGKETV